MKPPNQALDTAYFFLLILTTGILSNPTNEGFLTEFKDATQEVESPFALEENILDLDLSSHYCQHATSFGKLCDYSQTNKTIRLPPGLKYSQDMPSFIELKIRNVSALHIYPTCISWIQVVKARYVKTFPSEQQSSEEQEECRTWLRLHDSYVSEISHGVLDVTIMNSKVSKINLKNQRDIMAYNSTIDHIEWLDWKGYKGHIANTSINIITTMNANSDLMVVSSKICVLEFESVTLNNSANQFYDSEIDVIYSYGLTFLGRSSELRNITINKLHKFAIKAGALAGLTLTDVHILKADPPAFVFYSPELIKLENVTIEGEPLEMGSKWIATRNSDTQEFSSGSKLCETTEGVIVCNLKSLPKTFIDFDHFEGKINFINLTLKNGNLIKLVNLPCNFNLTLIHCNVSDSIQSKPMKPDEDCRVSLKARHSDIGYIQSWNINLLDFENVKINSLNASKVSYIHFKYVEIDEVRSLITNEDSRVCIQYSKVGKISHAVFNEPIKLEHSQISSIAGDLTLNHEDKSSLFLNSSIDFIGYRGIHLLSGNLHLNEVKIKHMQEQSIFLEKDSMININNSFSFPRLGLKSISVMDHEQAHIHIPSLPIKTTDWVLYVRPPQSEERESLVERFHLNNSTAASNSYCETSGITLPTIKCNFENMEVEVEITYPVQLMLGNCSYLILHPSCSSMIYLTAILNGTIMSSDSMFCKTSIHMQGSSIYEMRGGSKDFLANSSHIENFIPTDEPFENILILNSTVSSIEGIEYSGINEISQSTIENLHMMSGQRRSELWIFDSHIKLIDVFGVTIKKGFLFNSVIEHVLFYGIYVTGSLNVTNTTLKIVEPESIIVEGLLNLQNVIIENGSLNSFLLVGGLLKCQNVTINGEKIISKDIIFFERTTIAEGDPTVSNNKQPTETSTNKKVDHGTEPPTVIKSDTKEPERPPSTNFEKHLSATSKMRDPQNSSLSWLFGILGFLIGAALMFGIIYAYILFRPDVQNLTPTVRWKVTDDEHDLIPSDEESTGERM